MSAVNAKLTQALFPLLTAALLATACSDSTAPSTGTEGSAGASPEAQLPDGPPAAPGGTAGTRGPTSPAERAPASDVLSPIGADTNTGARLSAAVVSSGFYTRAYCEGGSGSRVVRVPTVGGVPFKYTGSGSTQRVWFRANFWSQTTYLGSSEWFYTDLAPGQQSTTMWYRYTTGQLSSWQSTMPVAGSNYTTYFADGEYQWHQNGRVVAQQVTRAYHIGSGAPASAAGANCLWHKWVWVG